MAATATKKPEAKIRKVNFKFEKPFPKHWYNDNPVATHFMNAQHLAFPDGEKFFIRSVKAFAEVYKNDPELKKRVDNFIGQEGTHYAEHQKFWDIMESQDLQPMKFVDFFRKTAWNGIENWARTTLTKNNLGNKISLSVTVALEHYTAMLAESGIINKDITEKMPQEMKDLFMWHAAEEIEHKSIPFDVLKRVDDSYALRVGGMAIATWGLWFYLAVGTAVLTYNDKDVKAKDIPKDLISFLSRFRQSFGGTLTKQFGQYFRRDFHPDQIENYHLAEELLKGKNYA
ncbi:MAG: metal-dependent hydrolase [Sphingobacteriales bacterium]|nr:metal-dependent hydrolase [Sphingobacteriales bacterium]